jgi:hypothetical protein
VQLSGTEQRDIGTVGLLDRVRLAQHRCAVRTGQHQIAAFVKS